jgi:hypothetical protein
LRVESRASGDDPPGYAQHHQHWRSGPDTEKYALSFDRAQGASSQAVQDEQLDDPPGESARDQAGVAAAHTMAHIGC